MTKFLLLPLATLMLMVGCDRDQYRTDRDDVRNNTGDTSTGTAGSGTSTTTTTPGTTATDTTQPGTTTDTSALTGGATNTDASAMGNSDTGTTKSPTDVANKNKKMKDSKKMKSKATEKKTDTSSTFLHRDRDVALADHDDDGLVDNDEDLIDNDDEGFLSNEDENNNMVLNEDEENLGDDEVIGQSGAGTSNDDSQAMMMSRSALRHPVLTSRPMNDNSVITTTGASLPMAPSNLKQ
jgi:hypothetical protein